MQYCQTFSYPAFCTIGCAQVCCIQKACWNGKNLSKRFEHRKIFRVVSLTSNQNQPSRDQTLLPFFSRGSVRGSVLTSFSYFSKKHDVLGWKYLSKKNYAHKILHKNRSHYTYLRVEPYSFTQVWWTAIFWQLFTSH